MTQEQAVEIRVLTRRGASVREIAKHTGVSAQAVANWIERRVDFPTPLVRLASGPVWDGRDVRRWLSDNRLIAHPEAEGKEMSD